MKFDKIRIAKVLLQNDPAMLLNHFGFSGKYTFNSEEIVTHCPFHRDRNPSFSINRNTGQWICFAGCGSGGMGGLLRLLYPNEVYCD